MGVLGLVKICWFHCSTLPGQGRLNGKTTAKSRTLTPRFRTLVMKDIRKTFFSSSSLSFVNHIAVPSRGEHAVRFIRDSLRRHWSFQLDKCMIACWGNRLYFKISLWKIPATIFSRTMSRYRCFEWPMPSDGKTEWQDFLDRFSSDVRRKVNGEIEETLINRAKNRTAKSLERCARSQTIGLGFILSKVIQSG